MGINAVIRCSSCDKVWRKAECKDGKCPLCTKIERALEYIKTHAVFFNGIDTDHEKAYYALTTREIPKLKEILNGN